MREADGPPCPVCATPNQPGRMFCRRCAAALDVPDPVAPLPWWRTRWPFHRRVEVTASTEVPGHPAGNAIDGFNNRYGGAPAVGDSLTFTFRTPVRLVDLDITSGASTDPQVYRSEARPITLDLVTITSKGQKAHKAIALDDKPDPQTIQMGISDVATVQLIIRSTAGMSPGRHIALAEIEFFKRS
ncbi:zinc ribbon domain-containing protein [Streptomyces sp. NPDC057654]|uniref:NADase-type glycan-binding domain-containing protein n=1 Tax=Streptomyces sp. NPDC057654 TaxID=3346196 RepID=UPI0036A46D07